MVKSVIFICNMNSIRSPMAAAMLSHYAGDEMSINSAGVYEGGPDPFIDEILREIGVSPGEHEPKAMNDIDMSKFDLAIVLTPEAAMEARRYLPRERIEFWPTDNPTDVRGGREELMDAYREVRDEILEQLKARFPEFFEKP